MPEHEINPKPDDLIGLYRANAEDARRQLSATRSVIRRLLPTLDLNEATRRELLTLADEGRAAVNFKLGKAPPKKDDRTFQLANYLGGSLLPAPASHKSWTFDIADWGMMGNDRIGDCTIAAAAHMIEGWTAGTGLRKTLPDADVIAAYSAVTGYDPITGANDNGAVEQDVLNYWRNKGIGGDKILAYADPEPGNHEHIKQSICLFGGCYIGIALPISAQNQVGRTWSVVSHHGRGAPGSWGGHAVNVAAYDTHGLTCVTWGRLQRMTWGFWNTYCDESHVVLSSDWASGSKPCPAGFDLSTLLADLESLR